MIRTICDGGINWNWYVCADFDETNKTAHIYYYERWHKYEHRGSYHPVHESGSHRVTLIEDDSEHKRIVIAILLDNVRYTVTNPANIFSYRDMTHYVAEK